MSGEIAESAPLLPLLLGQAVFTAVAALLVLYLLLTRGRTVSEGREHAIFESLALANRTLPFLRQGLNRATAARTAAAINDVLRPPALAIVGGRHSPAHPGARPGHPEGG